MLLRIKSLNIAHFLLFFLFAFYFSFILPKEAFAESFCLESKMVTGNGSDTLYSPPGGILYIGTPYWFKLDVDNAGDHWWIYQTGPYGERNLWLYEKGLTDGHDNGLTDFGTNDSNLGIFNDATPPITGSSDYWVSFTPDTAGTTTFQMEGRVTCSDGPGNADPCASDVACIKNVGPLTIDPPDNNPPNTIITSVTPSANPTTSTSITFTYNARNVQTGQIERADFQCALDTSPQQWSPCGNDVLTGTKNYPGPLSLGSHTFYVRARDGAGNLDPTPATYTWSIVAPPPGSFTFTVSPCAPGGAPHLLISWTSSPNATYYVIRRSDGAPPVTVNAPALSYADYTITPGTNYAYNMIAYNSSLTPYDAGWSPYVTAAYCPLAGGSCSVSPPSPAIGANVDWTVSGVSGGTGNYIYNWDGEPPPNDPLDALANIGPTTATSNTARVSYSTYGVKSGSVTISSDPVTPQTLSCGTVDVDDPTSPIVGINLPDTCYTAPAGNNPWPESGFLVTASDPESGVQQVVYQMMKNGSSCWNFVTNTWLGCGPNSLKDITTETPLYTARFPYANFGGPSGDTYQARARATNNDGDISAFKVSNTFRIQASCNLPYVQTFNKGDIHSNDNINLPSP